MYRPVFFAAVKNKYEKIKKPALTTPIYFVFKICIALGAILSVKILEDFTEGN